MLCESEIKATGARKYQGHSSLNLVLSNITFLFQNGLSKHVKGVHLFALIKGQSRESNLLFNK